MSEDIVDRLLASVNSARATDRSDLLREAAAEIRSLRSVMRVREETVATAFRLTTTWAYRSGWQEGGMLTILHRLADPIEVAKQCLERFDDSTQKIRSKPRKRSKK